MGLITASDSLADHSQSTPQRSAGNRTTIFEIVDRHHRDTFPLTVKVTFIPYVRSCLASKTSNGKYENHFERSCSRRSNSELVEWNDIYRGLFNGHLHLHSAAEFVLAWSDGNGIIIEKRSLMLKFSYIVTSLLSQIAAEFPSDRDYDSQKLFQDMCDDFICFLGNINDSYEL
jgi:hypothetical protein